MRHARLVFCLSAPLIALLAVFAFLPRYGAGAAPTDFLARGPFVANQTITSVQIIWHTAAPTGTLLRFGIDLPYAQEVASPELATVHVVTLTNLQPNTHYWYGVFAGEDAAPLAAASFRTSRTESQPYFTFAAIGDSGTASSQQVEVAALLQRLQPAFVVHTGDVIYPAGEPSGFDPRFFVPYSRTLPSVPFYTSLGNHDHGTADGAPYLANFYLPSNNPYGVENFYSFDYGNAHFVALDTLYGTASPTMTAWLSADLAATTKFWKFVYFHHAIYTSGAHAYDGYITPLRAVLAPIFEQYNVDLVFMGHDHAYERSKVLRDFVPGSRGVRYIVTGGGGAPLYPRLILDGYWTEVFYSLPDYWHAVKVSIANCALTLQAIKPPTDEVFDTLTLDRCQRVFLPIISVGYLVP